MTVDPAPRPLYYHNQYLGAEDLDAAVHYSAEKAARHALGAHTWGVGAGLAVTVCQSDGAVSYWVQPGVAWDGFGRTLVVPAPMQITADLLRSVVYNSADDGTRGHGHLVQVWLRYREDATNPPGPGFAPCDDGGFARAIEGVSIVVHDFQSEAETQQHVDVGGRSVSAHDAIGAWYPPAGNPLPGIEDGSVAFQRFPGPSEASWWLVPIGVLRWKAPKPGVVGNTGRFMPPQPGDEDVTLQRRRLVGVVAGTVIGTEGLLRLRPRTLPAPSVWTPEPIWLESTTRLDGDLRLFSIPDEHTDGGGVDFRNAAGETAGRQLRISRNERDNGADLRVQLGSTRSAANRLVVGTESTGDPPVFTGSVVVTSNARVGIGTDNPQASLHVTGRSTDTDENDVAAHVAIIENRSRADTADVLALCVRTRADQVGTDNNFITFFAGATGGTGATAIGCIEGTPSGTGIQFASGGADFAESVPAADGEELSAGDVVAVVAGRATRSTGAASWISVITDRAILLGNASMGDRAGEVAVTMLGQVPVRVRGDAHPGDLLVPSGDEDGAALAYAASDVPVERANQAFGEVVSVVDAEPDSVLALVGARARSSALIAIVQRLHDGAG